MRRKYKRRSAKEWQKLIDQFHSSSQSGIKFCSTHRLPYASFNLWRKKLAEPEQAVLLSSTAPSAFLDLGNLATHHGSSWKIVLRLGADIELVLSQP